MPNNLFKLKRKQNETKTRREHGKGLVEIILIDEGKEGVRQGGVGGIRMYYINYDIMK